MTAVGPELIAARLYAARGYVVERPVSAPEGLEGVDLIARRGGETVFVQVKRALASGAQAGMQDRLTTELAQAVAAIPWARLDVVVLPGSFYEPVPDSSRLRTQAAEALALLRGDDVPEPTRLDAALVLLSAAAEGALVAFALRAGLTPPEVPSLAGIAAQLRSEGLLRPEHWDLLDRVASARDALVHGLPRSRPEAEMLFALEKLIEAVAVQTDLSADDLIAWFHDHYKDPAEGVPHDSSEGGYQYVAGGPFDAREVLEDAFEFVAPSVVDEAVNAVELEATEWVDRGSY